MREDNINFSQKLEEAERKIEAILVRLEKECGLVVDEINIAQEEQSDSKADRAIRFYKRSIVLSFKVNLNWR